MNIVKSRNQEKRQVTFVVMVPEEVDAHGDITSAEEIAKACHNFNTFCGVANLFHMVETDTFDIVESYIAPTEFTLDEHLIKQGTWLQVLQVKDDTLWELIKSGEINGLSIGAVGTATNLGDDNAAS